MTIVNYLEHHVTVPIQESRQGSRYIEILHDLYYHTEHRAGKSHGNVDNRAEELVQSARRRTVIDESSRSEEPLEALGVKLIIGLHLKISWAQRMTQCLLEYINRWKERLGTLTM